VRVLGPSTGTGSTLSLVLVLVPVQVLVLAGISITGDSSFGHVGQIPSEALRSGAQ
jgi:hypothetical protein